MGVKHLGIILELPGSILGAILDTFSGIFGTFFVDLLVTFFCCVLGGSLQRF